ncbi:MAG: HAD family hydrolase [Dehalococcoidia bacterium]
MENIDRRIIPNIKHVYFDFFNTLAEFYPPREQLQRQAANDIGIEVGEVLLKSAYKTADAFMGEENKRYPLANRTSSEVDSFWTNYEKLLLTTAGAQVTDEEARLVFKQLSTLDQRFILFEDVLPTLRDIKKLGISIGIISNMNQDLRSIIDKLGILTYIDCIATSGMAGSAKPDKALFDYALDLIGAQPDQSAHVGDDYEGDVVGAINAGLFPVFLDRNNLPEHPNKHITSIHSLKELIPLFK